MRRTLVCLGLFACSRSERAPAPDPAPPPTVKAPAIDAAAVDAADPCTPMVAAVDDANVAIAGASAVTLVDRSDRPTAVQIYVWLSGSGTPPGCDALRAGGFTSGPRYALLTYPLVPAVPMAVGGRNARSVDARISIDRRATGSVTACLAERVVVSPEWDGATHRLAVSGSIVAADCGTRKP